MPKFVDTIAAIEVLARGFATILTRSFARGCTAFNRLAPQDMKIFNNNSGVTYASCCWAPVPSTLIDFLQPQFSTVNLAHWGDALADIILKGQFWPYLQSGSSDAGVERTSK